MEDLFGIPMTTIAAVCVAITALIAALLGFLALRNPVMFKTGLRNIPRRRTQTALIVFGLMLATVIMTAAFGTGDTVVNSVTDDVYELMDETDLTVNWDAERFPRPIAERLLPLAEADALREAFAGDPDIDGFLPVIGEALPVVSLDTRLNESGAVILGYDPAEAEPFGLLRDVDGRPIQLGGDRIAINEDLAEELDAEPGHRLLLLWEGAPIEVEVAAIAPNTFISGAFAITAGDAPGGAMHIDALAGTLGLEGVATDFFVSTTGGVRGGLDRSDAAEAKLRAYLAEAEKPYAVNAVKKDAIDGARTAGSAFTTIFVIFGLFSIAAGILLIFLIFIMLAAERKPEMGMARAVGAKRRHLVESFLAEGMGYDLGAALVGLGAGIGVTYAMIALINSLGFGLDLRVSFTARSLVVSFCLGVIATFLVIFLAALRASRLNIVAAIRDLPETSPLNPDDATWRGYARSVLMAAVAAGYVVVCLLAIMRLPEARWLFTLGLLFGLVGPWILALRGRDRIPRWPFFLVPLIPFYLAAIPIVRFARGRAANPSLPLLFLGILLPPLGLALAAGQPRERAVSWSAGFAVTGLGLAVLLLEWTFASDRAVYFLLGVSLIFFWIALTLRYFRVHERLTFTVVAALLLLFWYAFPTDIFNFLTGELDTNIEIFFVSGLVMVTAGTFLVVSNADILLPAVAAVGARLGRIVPAVKTAVAYPLTARMRTGMTIMMIGLISFSLINFSTVNANFVGIFLSDDARGGFDTQVIVNGNNPVDDFAALLEERGIDAGPVEAAAEVRVAGANETEIADPAAPGDFRTYAVFGGDRAFLETIEMEFTIRGAGYDSDAAVWRALADDPGLAVIPASLTQGTGPFDPQGDEVLRLEPLADGFQPFALTFRDPGTERETTVTVIAQLDDMADTFWPGILVRRDTLLAAFPDSGTQLFYLKTAAGTDQDAFAKTIEAGLVQASAESLDQLLDDQRAQSSGFLRLFQGFMGLGLIVGIAALGVIAFRAVVERRQQIGMLRAIGYQRSMVALSFLFESGFVALSGIVMGLVMGVSFAWVLFASGTMGEAAAEAGFTVPWAQLAIICGIAFASSMVMTWFPSRGAAGVAVAEALRYE